MLLWIKRTWETAGARRALWPFSSWNMEIKLPYEGALPVLGGRKTLLSPEMGNQGKKSAQTSWDEPLSSWSFLHNWPPPCLGSLSERYKSFLLWSLLQVCVLLGRFSCACKNMKPVCLSPVSLSCQFNSYVTLILETQRRQRIFACLQWSIISFQVEL